MIVWTCIWLGFAPVSAGVDTQPATRPAGKVVQFQPGVRIDFAKKQIEIDSTVVLREGLLELFACSPGTREHESILRVNCRPVHIFQGLGLIGLTPGSPPAWDEKKNKPIPPTGDPVDVFVRYRKDGKTVQVHACNWMIQGDKPLPPRHWVFAGSFRNEDGRLAADGEGTVVTVVDFADALLALPESHTADNEQLWLSARTEVIPPLETSCTLILRPAGNAGWRITLDRFGRLTLGGKPITKPDLQKQLAEKLRSAPELEIHLRVDDSVSAVVLRRTVEWLKEIGIPPERIRITRNNSARFPDHDPEAGVAFFKDQMQPSRVLLDRLAENHRQLGRQLRQAVERFDEIGKQLQDLVRRGKEQFRRALSSARKKPDDKP